VAANIVRGRGAILDDRCGERRYWAPLISDANLIVSNDYSAEFRQQVLRRVAEKDDLDAVAREFGLPADLVFRWLKDSAESGPALGAKLPPPSPPERAAPARKSDWRVLAAIYGSLFAPALLLFSAGHIQLRERAGWVCLPVWILIGCGVFFWLLRTNNRSMDDNDEDPSPIRRLGIAAVLVVLSALSAWIFSLGLPAIPHRLTSRPVDVRTTIMAKTITHGKSTHYCFETTPAPPDIESVEMCTDRGTFSRAWQGESIAVHGTASWFGFMRDRFELLPKGD
jgi:transposase-like protein